MRSKTFRIISVIVLLAAVSMFTGLESVVSAAQVVKAEKSCCDGCGHDEDQDSSPVPKSAPGCPAFLCLSVDVVEPVTTQIISSETVPFFAFIPDPIPDPFIRSIFHPPLHA
ncbi:hypothetical protein [Geobacter sp.]|uniref:hypothetical protein n=1 Tax=Geobacter sp. TaxID=46610 RepID=UPI00262A555A|nr:hypothetical protein [Geobacter sp.]